MKSARAVSINVGVPRAVTWRGQSFTTSIVKEPVVGSRRIEGVNLVGDDQADRTVHGGPDKAVYVYSLEDYAWWSAELDREMSPGMFGENLTTSGVDLNSVAIGEQWRVGTALLEVSEPRIPCFKLGYRMDDPGFPKRFAAAMRFGTYVRIVEEGDVEAGSAIARFRAADEPTLTTRDVGRIFMFAQSEKRKLVEIHALGQSWRDWAVR